MVRGRGGQGGVFGRSDIGSGVRVEVVLDMCWEDLEDQSLEVKKEDASELLLDDDTYDRGCWGFG